MNDRSPTRWPLGFLTALLVACGTLRADDSQVESPLTVSRLFGAKEFDVRAILIVRLRSHAGLR